MAACPKGGQLTTTSTTPEKPMTDHLKGCTTCGHADCDTYFGGCPDCGCGGTCVNIGRAHWIVCDAHRKRWYVGSNLFSSWREQTEEDWRWAAETIRDYEDVSAEARDQQSNSPSHPHRATT
jgi:hypothetical protein